MIKRIAVVQWTPGDELANTIGVELIRLGLEPVLFPFDGFIPNNVDMVLTFAPYGRLLPIASQMAHFDLQKRPVYVHWNTENPPDPNIPWCFTEPIACFRSWIDRLSDSHRSVDRFVSNLKPLQWLRQRMYRFRYVGDYRYACLHGWMDLLAEASLLYAQQGIAHGLPAVHIPWGTSPDWHAELQLERDIDVLWFGKRRTRRRSKLIDSIRHELRAHGVEMHVLDGVEQPFIYGNERTQLLNRAKLTISLLTQPYESVFPYRFYIAAGNRCMVISEPELDHQPQCIPGRHFIAAEAGQIVEQILYYLSHENERNQITENAYQLVTQELTMANSLKAIVQAAERVLANKGYPKSTGQSQVTMHLHPSP